MAVLSGVNNGGASNSSGRNHWLGGVQAFVARIKACRDPLVHAEAAGTLAVRTGPETGCCSSVVGSPCSITPCPPILGVGSSRTGSPQTRCRALPKGGEDGKLVCPRLKNVSPLHDRAQSFPSQMNPSRLSIGASMASLPPSPLCRPGTRSLRTLPLTSLAMTTAPSRLGLQRGQDTRSDTIVAMRIGGANLVLPRRHPPPLRQRTGGRGTRCWRPCDGGCQWRAVMGLSLPPGANAVHLHPRRLSRSWSDNPLPAAGWPRKQPRLGRRSCGRQTASWKPRRSLHGKICAMRCTG